MKTALEGLKPQFERATGHKLSITYGTAVPLKRQVDGGEAFDVVPGARTRPQAGA